MNAVRALAVIAAASLIAAAAPAASQQRGKAKQAEEAAKAAQPPSDPTRLKPLNEKQFPQNVSWAALSLNGKNYSGEPPSMVLDAQYRLKGFAGCNTFSATAFPLREQRFAVGPFALTRKSCAGPVMAAERTFLTALRTSVKWDLVGSTLVVQTQAGELRFERSL